MSSLTAPEVQQLLRATSRAIPHARTVEALEALLMPIIAVNIPSLCEVSCTADDGKRLLVSQMVYDLESLIEERCTG